MCWLHTALPSCLWRSLVVKIADIEYPLVIFLCLWCHFFRHVNWYELMATPLSSGLLLCHRVKPQPGYKYRSRLSPFYAARCMTADRRESPYSLQKIPIAAYGWKTTLPFNSFLSKLTTIGFACVIRFSDLQINNFWPYFIPFNPGWINTVQNRFYATCHPFAVLRRKLFAKRML